MAEDRTLPPPGFEWVPAEDLAEDGRRARSLVRVTKDLSDAIADTDIGYNHCSDWSTVTDAWAWRDRMLELLGGVPRGEVSGG